ncbi:MAG: 4Fe-4S dicluster domain-containing protein [Pseudomonadota bacterium]
MDSARRHFLRGGFLTRQGREGFECNTKARGPAPPWHVGSLRQEICTACEHPCVQACEMDIIRLHGSEHGLAGTPYLSFEQGGCTFCQACLEACPMELEGLADTQVRIGTAALDVAACLAWSGVVCMSCRFSCTWRAITLDAHNRPSIDAEICTGCGLCVGVCPKQAITVAIPR